jgi:hypothetical protein
MKTVGLNETKWPTKRQRANLVLNKKKTCTNKLGKKISCPSIWLQIDLSSPEDQLV